MTHVIFYYELVSFMKKMQKHNIGPHYPTQWGNVGLVTSTQTKAPYTTLKNTF